MKTIIGSTKIEGKRILLHLYEWDQINRTATIGVNNHPPMQKPIKTNENGDYVVHGYTKYYYSDFKAV